MWTKVFFATAFTIAIAEGMCFGVPHLQQTKICPSTMVYSQEFCTCIDKRFNPRLGLIVDTSRDPIKAQTQRLFTFRNNIVVGLPDTGLSTYARTNGGVLSTSDYPMRFYADSSYQTHHPTWLPKSHKGARPTSQSHRMTWTQWRGIGDLNDYLHQDNREISENLRPHTSTRQWPKILNVVKQVRPKTMIETLKPMQKAWRRAALKQAQHRFGNQALANKFFDVPNHGVSPDTPRNHGLAPDFLSNKNFYNPPKSLLTLKKAVLIKHRLENTPPVFTFRSI